ncbi:MAG: cytochrome c biogenesis protein CcdA [Lachnospiraceae bacterium]|nr:cytochrome c biogenesis protein CcdA [Lachnospiraceae bacterium]
MEYLITFLEGIISFISPCMLPMLPIYISYFTGASKNMREDNNSRRLSALPGACSFVVGFTFVFCLLGVFAGSIGMLFIRYQRIVNIICGIIVIFLGLSFMEIVHIPFFRQSNRQIEIRSIFSAFLFGMIFSISITPCVGSFLGAALMMASTTGGIWKGFSLLLVYSLGLGLPFIVSAVLINELKNLFDFIKKHYRIINIICGIFLIAVGVMMAFGWLNKLLAVLSVI